MIETALSLLKTLFTLAIVVVVFTLARALFRTFMRRKNFGYGLCISLIVAFAYYLYNDSVVLSIALFFLVSILLYTIWLVSAYFKDRVFWREAKDTDSYGAYASYLRMNTKIFHKRTAMRLAKTRLKQQILFLSLLRQKSSSPIQSIPIALGEIIVEKQELEPARLSLSVNSRVDKLIEAYRRTQIGFNTERKNLEKWRAELNALRSNEYAIGTTADYDIRLQKAEEQVLAHERLVRSRHELLSPEKELSKKVLSKIESNLESVMQRAFSFVIPAELLEITLAQTNENSTFDCAMGLAYEINPIEVSGLVQKSTPPVNFLYVKSNFKWDVVFNHEANELTESFETTAPKNYTNKYGIKRTYAYLIVRAYADFSWELLRAMGFVRGSTFDSDRSAENAQSESIADLIEKFKNDTEGVMEGQIGDLAGSVVIANWIAQNHLVIQKGSMEIEEALSTELQEFFENSLEILNSILVIPESIE